MPNSAQVDNASHHEENQNNQQDSDYPDKSGERTWRHNVSKQRLIYTVRKGFSANAV